MTSALKNLKYIFLVTTAILLGSQSLGMGAKTRNHVDRVINQNQLSAGALFGESTSRARTQYHLSLQEIPIRKGSFFGVIVQLGNNANPKKEIIPASVAAYVIDPVSATLYSMTPLTLNDSGIALWDDRPTLQLQITRERILVSPVAAPEGAPQVTLAGYQDTISFEWDSNFRLSSAVDGVYGKRTSRKESQLSISSGGQSIDSSLNLGNFNLMGTFSARSYLDGIATLRGTKVSVYGTEEETRPRALYVNLQVVDAKGTALSSNVMIFNLQSSGTGTGYLLPRIQ